MIKVRDGYGKLIGSNYNGNIAHVLLSNGGNLEYAVGSTSSTLVLRNASGQIESSVASTVAPFVISSTKVNTNLNADLLDGFLATGLFQSLTSAADKNLYIKIGDTEKEVPLLYASYLGGVTKEGLFTELTNVNDSTNPNSIKVTIGDTTKYLKVAYSDLAGKVVCSSSTNDVDRPIVVTNTSNGVYYSTKVTLNYSTGNVTAPTFTGTLIGNADTATTASKLSTVSKTAWGLTYWTSDGVPTSISGDMIGVGNITFNKEKAFNIVSGGSFLPTSNTDDYRWGVHRYDTNVAIAVMPASGTFQSRFETHLAFESGNVGIGNTSPQQKLDVSGKIKADALYLTRSNGDIAFTIAEESDTNGYNISASGGSSFIRFYTNSGGSTAVEQMRIHTNGYVGIGTPTPGHKLHVVGNTWAAGFIKQDSSDDYVLLGGGGHKLLSELGISGGPYLPLSGGVLSGHLALGTPATTALLLLSIERNNNKLSMLISGANEGWLLHNYSSSKSTALIQNETRGLLFKDTSDNYFNVWHAGNDGSGSGLDADLLDGKHLSEIIRYEGYSNKNANKADTPQTITYWAKNGGYGSTYGTALNIQGAGSWNNRIAFRTDGKIDYYQGINTGDMSYIGQIAFTSSNVASATKLQTARTIWGLPFDGTANVDGILKMNVNVTAASVASSALQINNTGTYAGPRLINAYSPNLPVSSSEANGVHLMFGVTDTSYNAAYIKFWYAGAGSTNNAIRFGFHNSDNLMSLLANGNVGIGTISPTYKLDVAGKFRALTEIKVQGSTSPLQLPCINWHDENTTGFRVSYRHSETTKPLRFYYQTTPSSSTTSTFTLLVDITSSGSVGIGTTAPIHKLQVVGAGVFNNTGSTTYHANGITIGAGDTAERYITCYGKTGLSYINVGYGPGINNSGEFFFNYVSNGSTSNYSGVGIYGGANYMYLYPDYTTFRKPLVMPGELYSGNCAINMSNSDIININALYTANNAESGTEGLQFSRGNGYYDSVWAASGVLYFSPNGNLNRTGSYGTNYTVLHTGNYTSILDSRYERYKIGTAAPTGTAVGWYRCALIASSNAGYSQNVIISLQRTYNSPLNEHYIFAISIGYNGQVSINLISGCVGGLRINKVRIVYNNSGACYFDYYMQTSNYTNSYKVLILAGDCVSYLNPTLVSSAGGTALEFTTVNGMKANYSIYAEHFYENSDRLLKTNITNINSSDNIPQLKEFDWKEDGTHSYGLIAQELEELGYSELVSGEEDGYKTVNYSAALSLIVGKLQVKIKELEKEIEILKNKN